MPPRNPPPPFAPDDPGLRELRQIQETFAQALFRPLAPGDRMQARWADGRPTKAVVGEIIAPNDQLTAVERLEIYNKVYWYRVLDSLYDDFPVVRAVVGGRRFMRLTTAYLTVHPSESYTLRDLGRVFPEFVREHPELVGPDHRLACECARFEWAQMLAFDSEARTPLALDAALGKDPATLVLSLQPYLTLLELAYPIDDFAISVHHRDRVRANASNTTLEKTVREPVPRVRKPQPETVWVGVHRQHNQLYYKRLPGPAYAILVAIQAGHSLAEACEAGAAATESNFDLGPAIQQWFHDWAALGWLCGDGMTLD